MPSVKFINHPHSVPLSLYDETREAVSRTYANLDGVLGVVESGWVRLAGLSDIDFIVIVEPGSAPAVPKLNTYSEQQHYAMCHKHFVMTSHTYQGVQFFDPWLRQVTQLYDPDQAFDLPPQPFDETGRQALSYHYILIYGVQATHKLIAGCYSQQQLDCRWLLETIKYIEHYDRELRRLGILSDTQTVAGLEFFNETREQWFTLSPTEQTERLTQALSMFGTALKEILTVALPHLQTHTALTDLGQFPARTTRQQQLLQQYPQSLIFDTEYHTYVYQANRDETLYDCETYYPFLTRWYGGLYDKTVSVLPLEFSGMLNAHLLEDGLVSRHYRQSICTDLEQLPLFDHDVFQRRAQLMDQNVAETKHVPNIKQPFDMLHYKLPPNVRSWSNRGHQWHDTFMKKLMHSPLGRPWCLHAHTYVP